MPYLFLKFFRGSFLNGLFAFIFLLFCSSSYAQSSDSTNIRSASKGIQWATGLSWEQVKQKANAENKYIFIDCYATWCGPCKAMDKDVYTDEKVGRYFNEKFLSIKVQMDTSKKDDDYIQSWYADAHSINRKYNLNAYPGFLFFNPQGVLVHQDFGYKNVEDFIILGGAASDPEKQFYSLLKNYRGGRIDYTSMAQLARKARQLNIKDLADKIAQEYLQNYLYKQKRSIQYKEHNLEFMRIFVRNSKEIGFKLYYRQAKKIDQLMKQKGYAKALIDNIITIEEITPILDELHKNSDGKPDWSMIINRIQKKYTIDYAERTVLEAQLRWYRYKNDWAEQAKYQIKKIDKYGLDTAGLAKSFANNMIWNVFFKHNNNLTQLNKAIEWMEVLVKADPYDGANIDTYANLLYKVGRIQDAYKWESIAIKLEPDAAEMKQALAAMAKGEPTYVNDGAIWAENIIARIRARFLAK